MKARKEKFGNENHRDKCYLLWEKTKSSSTAAKASEKGRTFSCACMLTFSKFNVVAFLRFFRFVRSVLCCTLQEIN